MSVNMYCKIVSFKEVHDMTRKVADEVKASGYKPTTVIGLARGGWIPARLMCDFLGITDLCSLKVEHWLQTGKTKNEATIKYPLAGDFAGKRFLVVDDIADTGKSLITSTEYLKQLNISEIRTATMQYIPQSKFKPDYFGEEVKIWTWFIYPWNWIEDTSTLIVRLLCTQKDRSWSFGEIKKGLKEYFKIQWNEVMLRTIIKTMVERGQIVAKRGDRILTYKLEAENVIQL
ncbi:MAG: uncharacterized protein QG670_1095 [Thermoproteota archaeon]|nr:uncharacterized protein [Thermoproteota archaeon]